ncbi:SWIM zinc finger domain-containing protein [Paenibacillus sp. SI8]|uniref:SWIM zinc finger family protein n=1 Tax=unclassified Paenibacillus TaxID=185978 RepID=UPI0034662B9E
MTLPVLNDEQWLKLLEAISVTFNEVTLSRGFTYYKQQRVASLSLSDNRTVLAKVDGSEDYSITLTLEKIQSSRCSCPVHTSCKHMAAVLMELADRMGYPVSQIVNAKHYLKRSTTISTAEQDLMQLPAKDVTGWHQFLHIFTSSIKPSYDQGYYSDMLRNHLQSLRKISLPFTDTDRIYFDLHQELFILRKIKEQHAQGGVSYFSSSFVYRLYDEIQAWLKQHSAAFRLTQSSERFAQTLSYLRQQMAEELRHTYQSYGVYTKLWKIGVTGHPEVEQWLTVEMDALKQLLSDSSSPSLKAAMAFMHLQASRSRDAWKALEESGTLKEAPVALFMPFLDHLDETQNGEDLLYWLQNSAPYFSGKKANDLNAYLGYWKRVIEHFPEAEEILWRILEEMLPHSLKPIEELVYEQRKWKIWVEMQIVQGHDPLYHRVSVLQPIEKESPHLLLPYYHQAVDHYVSLKNRHDYKLAVKLLKRLEKVYKRMKQAGRWEIFLAGFAERHSRLRALHEELKKGKLLA